MLNSNNSRSVSFGARPRDFSPAQQGNLVGEGLTIPEVMTLREIYTKSGPVNCRAGGSGLPMLNLAVLLKISVLSSPV